MIALTEAEQGVLEKLLTAKPGEIVFYPPGTDLHRVFEAAARQMPDDHADWCP